VIDVLFMPTTRDRLIPALLEGQGDIIAANLTITEGRQRLVDFSAPVRRGIEEVVVTGPGAPEVGMLDDLSGQRVYVRLSSSYAESLDTLNAEFQARGREPVTVVPVDERLEDEDVLDMVNAGVFPIGVVDDYYADLWARVLGDLKVHRQVTLGSGGDLAWAIRPDSPRLKGFLDDFLRTHRAGTLTGNVILNRYLRKARRITNPVGEKDIARFRSMVGLFEKYGEQYELNWLLLVAQAYQESGLDQSRRSPRGAVGVMQLLPSTALDPNVNVPDIETLESNIHAGARYLRFILDRYFSSEDLDEFNRHLFAFAAYNAGPGRVAALRRQAAQLGLDPNQWMDNVEVVAAREVGREPVEYVANIVKYYFAYRLVAERSLDQHAARQAAQG
jgi:membrane-bound lytic murein transglycosylase MltF